MPDNPMTAALSTEKRSAALSDRDLRRRLSLAALGIAPLDLGFTGAYLVVSGGWEAMPQAVGLNLLLLVAVNLVGIYVLLRPLRYLGPDAPTAARRKARRRMRTLSVSVPLWGFALGIVYCAAVFLTGSYVEGPAPQIGPWRAGLAFLWFGFVYGFYFAFYAYFATADALALYRRDHPDEIVVGLSHPMAWKFLLVAFALAVMPAAQILQDLTWLGPIRAAQGLTPVDAVLLDLMATSIAAGLSLYFVGRNLLRPVGHLVDGLDLVATGRFDVRLPALSDDEFGDLAHRFNLMVHGLAERRRVEEMFSKYVAPSVARALLSDSRDGTIRTERQVATNLFADIEGFTKQTEGMAPDAAIDMLNAYFAKISAPITEEGGAIVNLTGDGLHAVFNVPTRRKGHAAAAVRAARKIQAELETARFGDGQKLNTRIGIHTGEVVAGSVGCDDRLHYTVYGDAVNIAARLEALNKELGTRTLISSQTLAALGEGGADLPLTRFPEVAIRGRRDPMTVYSLG